MPRTTAPLHDIATPEPWLISAPSQAADPTPVQRKSARALPYAISTVFFALYCTLSLRRHEQMRTAGYDLGIFEQAIRSYAHLRAPVADLKAPGYDLLGDHFHPIIALIAPFYRVFPSPVTLLVAQAALMALAVLPLSRWAHRTLGRSAALIVGFGVGASWGLVQAVAFDFHEVAFAVPLLAFALEAAGQHRWRAAAAWAAPLALVKEDLGLTVAVLGLYIAWKGPRRLGIAMMVAGATATAVEMLVVIPALNVQGSYDYSSTLPASQRGLPADLVHLALSVFWPAEKPLTLLLLFVPTAFLALRSPLAVLTFPTFAWRFFSNHPAYWGMLFHYNAVLVPIIFAAFIDALSRKPFAGRAWRTAVLGVSTAATAAIVPFTPLIHLADTAIWRTPAHVVTARSLLRMVPDGVSVGATNHLAAQLTNRTTVSLECYAPQIRPRWIIADLTDSSVDATCTPAVAETAVSWAKADGYRQVMSRDGIVLLQRESRHYR